MNIINGCFLSQNEKNDSKDFILLNGHVGHYNDIACLRLIHVSYKQ